MQIRTFEQGTDKWHDFKRGGRIGGTRLGTIWSARAYNKEDIEKLLISRGVDLTAYQKTYNEDRKALGLKSKAYTKGDIEKLLTEDDIGFLQAGGDKKIEFYQILADEIAVPWNGENVMDRGLDLEPEATAMFADKFKKNLIQVGVCVADDNDRIYQSPDGLILPEGVEYKTKDEVLILPKGKKITEAVEVKCLASAKHLMAFFERRTPEDYWTQKIQYFVVNPDLETLYWVFYDPRIPLMPFFVLVIKREDLGHWPDTMKKYQLRTLKEIEDLKMRLFEEQDQIMLPAKPEKGITHNED